MMRCEWTVSEKDHGEKLLPFLKKSITESFSNRKIKGWIDTGLCSINGRAERFHHTRLAKQDKIKLTIPDEQEELRAEFSPERILFEDEWFLVYNKPAGLTCDENGLVASLVNHAKIILTHRLDKDTSGVIITAKHSATVKEMEEQFRCRKIKKQYVAIVHGLMEQDKGTIENYLGPLSKAHGQQIWGRVHEKDGFLAVTDWQCLKRGLGVSLVGLYPFTGRTHQLRVHMSLLHHPILGDSVYGPTFSAPIGVLRQMLHAEKISFWHPHLLKNIEVVAPLPEDFKKVFKSLFP